MCVNETHQIKMLRDWQCRLYVRRLWSAFCIWGTIFIFAYGNQKKIQDKFKIRCSTVGFMNFNVKIVRQITKCKVQLIKLFGISFHVIQKLQSASELSMNGIICKLQCIKCFPILNKYLKQYCYQSDAVLKNSRKPDIETIDFGK